MPGTTPTPTAYSNVVDEVVVQQYMRNEWDQTKKVRAIFEELDRANRIMMDGEGKFVEWKARVGKFQKGQRADLEDRNWARKQHRVTFTAPWSFHETLGVISERDKMFLQNPTAIVDVTATMLKEMGEDFGHDMNSDVLNINADTNSNSSLGITAASGTEVPLYGLPTVFATGSGTVQAYEFTTKTGGGNIAATDKEALPNATYCGVSTDPTATLSGVDNAATEATSPVLANWSSTAWTSGGGSDWKGNSTAVLTHLHLRLTRGSSVDERPNIGFMDLSKFSDFKAQLRSESEQHVVLTDEPKSPDVGMHPRLWVPYEGVRYYMDLDTPSNVIYCLNTKHMSFRVYPQQPAGITSGGSASAPLKGRSKEMFAVAQAPDINQGGHKVVSTLVCQLICNPRYQGVAYNWA